MDAKNVLEFILEKEGVSYNSLAKLMGIPRTQSLYNIRDGHVKSITKNYAQKIIDAFPSSGYNMAFLLTGDINLMSDNSLEITDTSKSLDEGAENLNDFIIEDAVKQRVREFINANDISVNAISKDTGYPQSNLNKQINKDTAMSVNTILVLLEHFPNLSAEWLLRGEGEMIRNENSVTGKDHFLDDAESIATESMIPYYEEVIKAKDNEILRLHKEMYLLREQLEKVSKTA